MTQAYSFVHPVDSGPSNQYQIHQIDMAKQIPATSYSGTTWMYRLKGRPARGFQRDAVS